MYGDAETAEYGAVCGDDTLIGAADTADRMWGDAATINGVVTTGRDRFVFNVSNGADTIEDFRHAEDKIHLKLLAASGIHAIGDLTITVVGADSVIDFGGGNSITVVGAVALVAADFIFA